MGFIASIFKLLFLMILAYVVYSIIMFVIRIFIHANRASDSKKSDNLGRNSQNRGDVIELDKDQYKIE